MQTAAWVSLARWVSTKRYLILLYIKPSNSFLIGWKRTVNFWNQHLWRHNCRLYNWMAWCKRDVSDFFRWNFFSFKSAWIFACAFQLSSTTFPCIFLPGLHFVSEKNKDKILKCAQWTQQSRTRAFQSEKRYRRMFFYLIEKHMQKFRHFWRKKNFTWKSHLRPSCTKPFNYHVKDTQGHRLSCHVWPQCMALTLTLIILDITKTSPIIVY